MTVDETTSSESAAVLDEIRGTRDALSVRRVFGDPYEVDGAMVIPVARVAGGAAGGGGSGTKDEEAGQGFGTGFGMNVRGIGVYQVRDGEVVWKPAIDAMRLARGGQVLAGLLMVCVTLVALRRSR